MCTYEWMLSSNYSEVADHLHAVAGLLTTEAGTLGRFSGNIVMSSIARLTGVETMRQLANFGMVLYGTFAILLSLIALYLAAVWRNLST